MWVIQHPVTSYLHHRLRWCRYFVTQGFIKLSLLLLYRNILRRTSNRVVSYVNWAMIAFISIFTIISYLITVFQCNPVSAAWKDPARYIDADAAPCLDQGVAFFVPSLIGTISDFFVAGSPMLFLRQLQLPKRQKCTLVLVFSLGFLYDSTLIRNLNRFADRNLASAQLASCAL